MDKVIQHNSRIFCFTKSWLANNFQSSLRKKRIVQKSSVLVVQCLCWFFEIWLVEVWKKFSHIVCFFFFLFFSHFYFEECVYLPWKTPTVNPSEAVFRDRWVFFQIAVFVIWRQYICERFILSWKTQNWLNLNLNTPNQMMETSSNVLLLYATFTLFGTWAQDDF